MQTWSEPGDNVSKLRKQSLNIQSCPFRSLIAMYKLLLNDLDARLCVFLFLFLFISLLLESAGTWLAILHWYRDGAHFSLIPHKFPSQIYWIPEDAYVPLLQYYLSHKVFVLWTSIISTSTRHENMPFQSYYLKEAFVVPYSQTCEINSVNSKLCMHTLHY